VSWYVPGGTGRPGLAGGGATDPGWALWAIAVDASAARLTTDARINPRIRDAPFRDTARRVCHTSCSIRTRIVDRLQY
jgi:hypothetical protein